MFSNKDAKIDHFHYFPEMLSQHDESRALCPELFRKKLAIKVIINSDCFSQNRSLKFAFEILNKKQLGFLLSLSRLSIMNNRVSS